MRRSRSELDPLFVEGLESRLLLSAVPFDLQVEAQLPDDLPAMTRAESVEVGPAATEALGGIDQASEKVADLAMLPEATGPGDPAVGPDDKVEGVSESKIPNDRAEVERGVASVRAAHGLAIAGQHVPEHVTLPEPVRSVGGDANGNGRPSEVTPGPASINAANGLSRAAEHVPDHVTLPAPLRAPSENAWDEGEDAEAVGGALPEDGAETDAVGFMEAGEKVSDDVELTEASRNALRR